MTALTIGMPTYNDFDGVYFTIQALRLYHDLDDTEIVVVDNYGCEHTRAFVEGAAGARYVLATEAVGTAAAKNRVFAEARSEAVLCCDSHVLFAPGVIARLKAYYRQHPETRDLLQGPLVYDDLQSISTHLEPVWRGQMWGIWGTDPRGMEPETEPFEVWGQGMGVFSCHREAWPGFHPAIRGFGGEEGYIHEKVRQAGGRCLCLPWLRWGHRFGRAKGVPYRVSVEDKFRNYLIGFDELGLDITPVLEHFAEYLGEETVIALAEETLLNDAEPARDKRMAKRIGKGKKGKKDKKGGKGGAGKYVADATTPVTLARPEVPRSDPVPAVRIGVLTPTHNRPDRLRALVLQMALQLRKPDILCIHQNGDPESYEWAIADLPLPFPVTWIHTPGCVLQDEWYSRPLKALLDDGCTHFFWCDDDDAYRSDHIARAMTVLSDGADPCDFVVNAYSDMLFMKKAGYDYRRGVRFSAHAPGGMSSSMAFNRFFAEALFEDLECNRGKLHFADQVVARVTMPRFRCKLDDRATPSTIYVCHPGADSSKHWLGEE
jgi:hypothetical protein